MNSFHSFLLFMSKVKFDHKQKPALAETFHLSSLSASEWNVLISLWEHIKNGSSFRFVHLMWRRKWKKKKSKHRQKHLFYRHGRNSANFLVPTTFDDRKHEWAQIIDRDDQQWALFKRINQSDSSAHVLFFIISMHAVLIFYVWRIFVEYWFQAPNHHLHPQITPNITRLIPHLCWKWIFNLNRYFIMSLYERRIRNRWNNKIHVILDSCDNWLVKPLSLCDQAFFFNQFHLIIKYIYWMEIDHFSF